LTTAIVDIGIQQFTLTYVENLQLCRFRQGNVSDVVSASVIR